MSAGGLIAQAALGATHGAATGIGERLREEAKLKRQKALETTRTENAMQKDAHSSALNMGEANHQAGLIEQRDERRHGQNKELVDYEGQQGKNDWTLLKGGDGTMVQYSPSRNESRPADIPEGINAGGDKLSDRDKYRLDMLADEAKALRKKQSEGLEPLTNEEKMRLGEIQASMSAMLGNGGGSGRTPLQMLLAGEGSGQMTAETGQNGQSRQPQQPQGETSIGGLVSSQMQQREADQAESEQESQREATIQRADAVLDKLNPGFVPGGMSQHVKGARESQKPQIMEEAKQVAQELMALEQQGNLSDDQKRWIAERLVQLQDAGVPLNLQQ